MFELLAGFVCMIGIIFITSANAVGRPTIVADNLPVVQRQGQIAYLNCVVTNVRSPAQVLWIKRTTPTGDPLHISSDETIRVGFVVGGRRKYEVMKYKYDNREIYQLIIQSVTETDAGNYTCQIFLPYDNYKEWPQKEMDLIVFTPPTFKPDNPAEIQAHSGHNITLVCEANGYPLPNITWKRNDRGPLPNGEFQERGSIYTIYGISVTDCGKFMCTADNEVKPPASFTVQLDVTFVPVCIAVQDVVGQGQNQRFNAKLECLVAANPRAEVSWYKKNRATKEREQIHGGDKYNLDEQYSNYSKPFERWYTLAIKTVQRNDYGDYYCVARNKYGENQAKVTLFSSFG
ncbi:lachesin-like [Mytilus edulis]|uniref:lachesin-like n=1 Tax=Mytilus edulis TaxID=6550 RepID=UPI0039EF08F8